MNKYLGTLLFICSAMLNAHDELSFPVNDWVPLVYIGSGIIIGAGCTWAASKYWLNAEKKSSPTHNTFTAYKSQYHSFQAPSPSCSLDKTVGFPNQMLIDLKKTVSDIQQAKELGIPEIIVPRNILILGESGSGKSHLARAIAGQTARPYFFLQCSDLFRSIDGTTLLQHFFAEARNVAPAVIFIDRIDILLEHYSPMLDELLHELENNSNLLIIMTCNELPMNSPLTHRCQKIINLSFPLLDERIAILGAYIPTDMQENPKDFNFAASYLYRWTRGQIVQVANQAQYNAFDSTKLRYQPGSLFADNETMSIDDPPATQVTYRHLTDASQPIILFWQQQYEKKYESTPKTSQETLQRESTVELAPPVSDG